MKRLLLWLIGVALGVVVLLAAVLGVSYSFTSEGAKPASEVPVRRAGAGAQRLVLAGAAAGRAGG